jgi:hypothetical protein
MASLLTDEQMEAMMRLERELAQPYKVDEPLELVSSQMGSHSNA